MDSNSSFLLKQGVSLKACSFGTQIIGVSCLPHETKTLLLKLVRALKKYVNFINNGDPYSHGKTLIKQNLKKRMQLDQLLQTLEQPKTGLDEKQRCRTCVLQEIKCKYEDLF